MIVDFSITPLGVGEDIGPVVTEAVRIIRASGLPNQTNAMTTLIEGDWDEVMTTIKKAVDAVSDLAPRVGFTIKADIRPGVTNALASKVQSVESRLA